jgi:ligand-binding sensor domain-containing protein
MEARRYLTTSLFLTCALSLLLSSQGSAQIAVDQWTADSGLPQNIVRAICQTPDGYLWLATFDGLVRFDGVRFTTYNRTNTPGIEGNRFGSLYCPANGDIWAGTELGGVTRSHQGRFTTYTVRDGLPSNEVRGISGDGQGNVWVLAHGVLAQWHAADQRFLVSPVEDRYADALSPDGRAGFWGFDGTSFKLFARGQKLLYSLPTGWQNWGSASSSGVDVDNRIWVSSGTGQLARLSEGRWSVLSSSHAISANGQPNALASDYRDSRGNVWRYEIEWRTGVGVVQYLDLPSGTQPARISFNTLFEDREGNIWLSTDGRGLYRLHSQAIHVLSTEQGLPDGNAYPIYQDREQNMWIGTWTGGLCRLRDGKLTTYTTVMAWHRTELLPLRRIVTACYGWRSMVVFIGCETASSIPSAALARSQTIEPFAPSIRHPTASCGSDRAMGCFAWRTANGEGSPRRMAWRPTTSA